MNPIAYHLALTALNAEKAEFRISGWDSGPIPDDHVSLTIRRAEWVQLGRPGAVEVTVRAVAATEF